MRSVLGIVVLALVLAFSSSTVYAQSSAVWSGPVAHLSGGAVYVVQLPTGVWQFQWLRVTHSNSGVHRRVIPCRMFMLPVVVEQNRRLFAQAVREEVRRGHECERYINQPSSQ